MPKIKYNFDNGYDNLSKVSVPLKILDFTFTETTSTYANFTPVHFVPDFYNSAPSIRDSNYFFDFGDGTKSDAFTATHIYKYPGEYKVTLVVSDSGDNIFRSSDERIVSVRNLIPDSIYLNYLSASNVEQNYSSLSIDPIYVTRYNSVSLSQLLSSDKFKIDLSVQDNRVPLVTEDMYKKDRNFHLKGNCFFANTRGKNFKVIDSVETTSVNLYAGVSGSEIIIKPNDPDDISNVFVGTSGFGTFYYYEDILEFGVDSGINTIFIDSPAPPTPSPTPSSEVIVLVDSDDDFVVDDSENNIEIDE